MNRIEELFESKGGVTGVASGFHDLDALTSGLQEADLVVIAGRPSMGKTSLAMNLAENAAAGSKLPVAVFSMEMPGHQLAMRMLASLGPNQCPPCQDRSASARRLAPINIGNGVARRSADFR